jgi:hypothetical protein
VLGEASGLITVASGGSLQYDKAATGGKLSLTVPAAFASSDAMFQVKQLAKAATVAVTGAPSDQDIAGAHLYHLSALADLDTRTSAFDKPLSVDISYADADIAGFSQASLAIYRWDETEQAWSALSDCSVDASAKKVTCATTHFSVFALTGTAAAAQTLPNTGTAAALPVATAVASLAVGIETILRRRREGR